MFVFNMDLLLKAPAKKKQPLPPLLSSWKFYSLMEFNTEFGDVSQYFVLTLTLKSAVHKTWRGLSTKDPSTFFILLENVENKSFQHFQHFNMFAFNINFQLSTFNNTANRTAGFAFNIGIALHFFSNGVFLCL